MIVRRASGADVAVLAGLRGVDGGRLSAYTEWVAAHAETHLPFVAEMDGRVVGAAWLHVARRVPSNDSLDRWYGDIQSVEVREDYRNRGVGSALMAAILAEARVRGLLHVTVHSSRRAVDFYLRNGFRHDRQILLWELTASRSDPSTATA
ncbi:GNAT family N-acetyltransferase [Micromonospora sp. NPDC048986]|uniref:GNAT family N-acetyltransferase n=1 Tax=Micromonospora sp. NPDC048986 TaxID=3155644 RepID=UPI0033ECDFA1